MMPFVCRQCCNRLDRLQYRHCYVRDGTFIDPFDQQIFTLTRHQHTRRRTATDQSLIITMNRGNVFRTQRKKAHNKTNDHHHPLLSFVVWKRFLLHKLETRTSLSNPQHILTMAPQENNHHNDSLAEPLLSPAEQAGAQQNHEDKRDVPAASEDAPDENNSTQAVMESFSAKTEIVEMLHLALPLAVSFFCRMGMASTDRCVCF